MLIPVPSDHHCPGIVSLSPQAESVLTLLPGDEHDASKTSGATPSFCTLPLFHQPAANSAMAEPVNGGFISQGVMTESLLRTAGHVSADGHIFPCKNPAQMQRAFHV